MPDLRPSLVVSIHDVSPRTLATCRRILSDLATCGVHRTSLLVIPNHHGTGHFLDDPDCPAWLQNMAGTGHEVVAHGYFHRRPRVDQETVATRVITRFYTADEGEFFDITHATATALIARSREEFARIHLNPCGFIAPAWLLGAAAEQALRDAGFLYTTRLGSVMHLPDGQTHRSQSLVWSVRSGWRRAMSLAWNAALAVRLRSNPLVRLGIHPPDWDHPMIRSQILRLTAQFATQREVTTYADWVQARR